MEIDWVKIFSSTNFYRSELVKQMLVSNSFDAVLLNKQDSSYGAFGSVEVYVHKGDFSQALELMILNEIDLAI
ncbi:putative signal transducing protein [Mucilaginibacter ginkgonis]|uniref:DUF2007 domain-containing protein n=1 Tax=Mucilaginibacter ginkgonis TaxID=2682091 RepID=A0A6I4I2L3_9SPHI|nr:DUF2007 domain-containing protein [Mucilaginibacter ginkgonis]QQL49523.1 DUF2007 domain-containing protein [Mucilaginibacter ginkgonis]